MDAPAVFGGIARLQRTSRVTTSVSGLTVARTKSGPIVNSGFGRDARKTCPRATSGTAAAITTARSQAIRLTRTTPSGRPRLAQPAPVDLRLDVEHALALELDLDFVVLDVPVVHGRQPAEPTPAVRDDAPSAVDQGAASGRAEALALLGIGPAEAQDFSVRRLAGRDARERFARDDCTGLAPGRRAARGPKADAPLEPRADGLDEHRDQRARQIAEDEEGGREEQRRPRLPAREVPELHRQDLGPDALGRIEVGRHDLGRPTGLAGAPLARARIDLVNLQMVGVGETDRELRRIVGQMDDAIAVRQVHRERRPGSDVVEAQGDDVTLAPERVLQPGGLLHAPQPRQVHPKLDEPRTVDEPRRPRDPDPAPRRALSEWAWLAGVRDERRAAGDRLGL